MLGRIAQFEQLVAQQPENELYRFSLAQALITSHRGFDAEPHLWLCVKIKSDWMLPRILLGKLLLATDRHAEAKVLLEEALRLAVDQKHDDPADELRSILTQF